MVTRAITDSHTVAHIYEQRYGRSIGVVPYGAEAPKDTTTQTLERGRLGFLLLSCALFLREYREVSSPSLVLARFVAHKVRRDGEQP